MPGTVSEPDIQKARRDLGLSAHPNYDPLLDLRESARYLSISEDSMGDLARNRQIAVVRSTNNGKMRFRLSALNAWIKSHELKPLRSAV